MGKTFPDHEKFLKKLEELEEAHDRSFAKYGYYRCFDGCPDTALSLKGKIEDLILDEIKKYYPNVRCTYFPGEEKFQVHPTDKNISRNIGNFSFSRKDALLSALRELVKEHNKE